MDMAAILAWDFSYSKPTVMQLRCAGISRVIAYCVNDSRGINRTQLDAYLTSGIEVAFVHERGDGSNLDDGYAAGVSAATEANGRLDVLGVPADVPVYYALDIDVPPTKVEWDAIEAFMRGAPSVNRPAGIYAEADVLNEMARRGVTVWLWEAGAYSWSQFRHCEAAVLRQIPGRLTDATGCGVAASAVDDNFVRAVDWGQCPRPTPTPPSEDPMTDDDWIRLQKMLDDANNAQNLTIGKALSVHLGDPIAGTSIRAEVDAMRHEVERTLNGVAGQAIYADLDSVLTPAGTIPEPWPKIVQ